MASAPPDAPKVWPHRVSGGLDSAAPFLRRSRALGELLPRELVNVTSFEQHSKSLTTRTREWIGRLEAKDSGVPAGPSPLPPQQMVVVVPAGGGSHSFQRFEGKGMEAEGEGGAETLEDPEETANNLMVMELIAFLREENDCYAQAHGIVEDYYVGDEKLTETLSTTTSAACASATTTTTTTTSSSSGAGETLDSPKRLTTTFAAFLEAEPMSPTEAQETEKRIQNNYNRAIFNLTAHIATRYRLCIAGALKEVIRALRLRLIDDAVLVATLSNLAYEEEAKRDIVCSFGGASLFVDLLKREILAVKAHAARGVFSLTTIYAFKAELAKAGAIVPLIESLVIDSDVLVMNAAGALANIAIHPDNKLPMVSLGGLDAVLRIGRESINNQVLHQVARCLFSLAAHLHNRPIIVQKNGLDVLRRLFTREQSPDVQSNAVGALGNLAMSEEAAAEDSLLFRLIPMLNSGDMALTRQVTRVLYSFSTRASLKSMLSEASTLKQLIKKFTLMEDLNVRRDAVGILANVIIGDAEAKKRVLQIGGLCPLVNLLRGACGLPLTAPTEGTEDDALVVTSGAVPEEIVGQTARAVFALLSSDLAKTKCVDYGGVEPLLLLASVSSDYSMHALGALANLATIRSAPLIHAGALGTIIDALFTDKETEARRQAGRALQIFTRPGGTTAAASSLVPSLTAASASTSPVVAASSMSASSTSPGASSSSSGLSSTTGLVAANSSGGSGSNHPSSWGSWMQSYLMRYGGPQGEALKLRADFAGLLDKCLGWRAVPGDATMTLVLESGDPAVRPSLWVPTFLLRARCPVLHALLTPPPSTPLRSKRKRTHEESTTLASGPSEPAEGLPASRHADLLRFVRSDYDALQILLEFVCTSALRATTLARMRAHGERVVQLARALELGAFTNVARVLASDPTPAQMEEAADADLAQVSYAKPAGALGKEGEEEEGVVGAGETRASTTTSMMMMLWGEDEEEEEEGRAPRALRAGNSWGEDLARALRERAGDFQLVARPAERASVEAATSESPALREWVETWSTAEALEAAEKRRRGADGSSYPTERRLVCHRFPVHARVLSARSSYFHHLLEGPYRDAGVAVASLDASPAALACFVRYLYCGFDEALEAVVDHDPNLCLELVRLANRYGLEGLQVRCEWRLLPKITKENALSFLRLASSPLIRTRASFVTLQHAMYEEALDFAASLSDNELTMDLCSHNLSWLLSPAIGSAFPDESPEASTR